MSLLPLPAFAAEMAHPRHRRKLSFGIGSGYGIVLAFVILAGVAHATGIMPLSTAIVAMIALKLATNTGAWIALSKDRFALELSGLNVMADVIAMTGAIHLTGGMHSPLVPIYGIELTVIALLTNVGVTVSVSALTFVCYVAMIFLDRAGILVAPPPVYELTGSSDTYRAIAIGFVAFTIALPTGFAASILKRLREKESALLARNSELVEAVREKGQFMANLTHELRTPIHGISGLADLVSSGVYGPTTEEQLRAARDIKGSALSLLRMIDDLLTLAREDAGRLEHRPSDVDLDEVLSSVMATVGFLRGTRELDVRAEVEGALPPMRADRAKLVQVLVNLLANAVKFTPDGGHVVLRARRLDEARVELAVEDDGVGISAKELGRIFEAFRQVDGSPERQYGGTGIGLNLVQKLCALMGGEVRVESTPGRGSTFTVTLPIEAPPSLRSTGEHDARAA